MNDTTKMLQIIINGQSTFRQEVLGRIDKLDKKLSGRIDSLDGKIDRVEKNLTSRIDKLGGQLAYLEDDTPNDSPRTPLRFARGFIFQYDL